MRQVSRRKAPRGSVSSADNGRCEGELSAIAGVDRPQGCTARALQVDPRRVIAQQVLPMRTAIATAAALRTLVAAPVAAGAGEPRAPGRIGVRINRQRQCHGGPFYYNRY